jgi:PilZ domain
MPSELNGAFMLERRRSARTSVFKPAQLLVARPRKMVGCTVRDLSEGGACLDLTSGNEVPEFIQLSFNWFRSMQRCEVRWRSETRIGVAFRF